MENYKPDQSNKDKSQDIPSLKPGMPKLCLYAVPVFSILKVQHCYLTQYCHYYVQTSFVSLECKNLGQP